MLFKRNLSMVVIATLLFTFISITIATPAQGKTSRVAVITELTGSATVKSAGGSREYDAYIDMGLNQGDYITTNADSSIKVKIKDHQDEFTIGANSVVSITTLADNGKGKKSKIKMFAGSVWSNVKKLSGGDDYEVETPTAVMAVRGTKLLTNVNSETGETYVAVAAGTVSAKTSTENDNNNNINTGSSKKMVLIAASQQLSLDSRTEVNNLETKVEIIDTKKLVSGTSSEIINAIVKDKQDIDRENAEFVKAQKDKIDKGQNTDISNGDANSSLTTKDQSVLDKVTQNLDNLIGNVVKSAIDSNKVNKDQINKIIEEVNKTSDKKLDLEKVIPLDNNAGVDEALKKAKDEELKKLDEARKAAVEAKKKEDEATKLKLAEALKKLQAEAERIIKEKEILGLNTPTPTPKPATPTPTPTPTPAPPATPAPIFVGVTAENDFELNNKLVNLEFGMSNLSDSDQVYGVEIHVVYNNSNNFFTKPPAPAPTSYLFDLSSTSVYRYDLTSGTTNNEFIFAAVIPGARPNGVSGNPILVNLPLQFDKSYLADNDPLKSLNIYVKVVNKSGVAVFNNINNTNTSLNVPIVIKFKSIPPSAQ
jgi:hypothetical protein